MKESRDISSERDDDREFRRRVAAVQKKVILLARRAVAKAAHDMLVHEYLARKEDRDDGRDD